ncbi:MAG: type II toxin-antitoxin system RelE/ParE family toxin [Bosea sp. (in: a-proteobacteria)]
MKIIFRRSCLADLAWFRSYYASAFPEGQNSAKAHFKQACLMLAANPQIGRAKEFEPRIRELVIARTPFSFVYTIGETEILVLRLLDNRAERPDSFSK